MVVGGPKLRAIFLRVAAVAAFSAGTLILIGRAPEHRALVHLCAISAGALFVVAVFLSKVGRDRAR